ncbi:alpha/beta hydrolase [Pseudomonas aeruginosa]|nr:alpha/beta hydrolase [Pseudomonas aeruginosa]
MHSERVRYVLVPGWYGSEDAHWQSCSAARNLARICAINDAP